MPRPAVDQTADRHPVVEVVPLSPDDVDLAAGVAPPNVVRGRHAGDPVPDHDDAAHGWIHLRVLAGSRPGGSHLYGERHRHRPLHPRATRHARPVGESKAVERVALVGRRLGEILGAVDDGDGVRAAHAHPAAGFECEPAALRDLEERRA